MDEQVPAPVSKALVRFAETVSSGAYYEAQQVLKSVYHRMRSRQQLENSYELASRAAVIQFGAAQSTCGAELGQLLIGDYETDKVAVTPGSLQRVMAILYAAAAAGMVDQLIALAKAALKWILACQGSRADAAQVHDCVAQHIYDAKGLAAATPFFVRASSLRPFAAAVKHVADEGGDSHEQGLFLLRAVLQSLLACDQMVEQGGDRCGPLLEAFSECQDPAAHFARLLLVALTPGKANRELYNTLCAFYRNAYETLDPSLQGMLDKIETIAFSDGRAAGFGGLLDALLT